MSDSQLLPGKLVRDEIPSIIRANGDIPETRILSLVERGPYLHQKLREEVEELLSAKGDRKVRDETADVIEVLRAITRLHNIEWRDVENHAKDKRQLRGAFKRFICLISTESRK